MASVLSVSIRCNWQTGMEVLGWSAQMAARRSLKSSCENLLRRSLRLAFLCFGHARTDLRREIISRREYRLLEARYGAQTTSQRAAKRDSLSASVAWRGGGQANRSKEGGGAERCMRPASGGAIPSRAETFF